MVKSGLLKNGGDSGQLEGGGNRASRRGGVDSCEDQQVYCDNNLVNRV